MGDAYSMRSFHTMPGILASMDLGAGGDLSWSPVLVELHEWWKTLRAHAQTYLSLFYADDGALKADVHVSRWYGKINSQLAHSTLADTLAESTAAFNEVLDL